MADHPAIAGLLCDMAGAALLARGLVLQSAADYVRDFPRSATVGDLEAGFNPETDLARARDRAEAGTGAALLIAGFAGQVAGSIVTSTTTCVALASYAAAIALIGLALLAVPGITRRLERDLYVARLVSAGGPLQRHDVHHAYFATFNQLDDRSTSDLDPWFDVARARLGRHPWDELRDDEDYSSSSSSSSP
jgi:hypothetical protein